MSLTTPLKNPPQSTGRGKRSTAPTGLSLARRLGPGVFTLAVGLLLAVLLIQAQGFQPLPTILAGLDYAVGDAKSIARTLAWGLPLFVATMGVALAYRSGMFNIGAEGQIYAGAMAAALTGAYIGPMFTGLHLFLCLAVSALTGAAVAAGLGWLRAVWNVDEVLSTLLSNYIIMLFCAYLATAPLRDPARQSGTTKAVHETAMFAELVPQTQLTSALFVVIILCAATWWLSERSVTGYRWRMTGESPAFAAAVGINVRRSRIGSMATSGALCGIAGALLVTASQGRFWTEIGTGIGWDAVLLAMIARARPLSAVVWVLVYSVMRSAARGIEQVSTVPSELSLILISGIIIAATARAGLFSRLAGLNKLLIRSEGK
ncbi:ABC transporter permease [Paeniglutamicibacter kerguelensis]|uniref:Simple sugar transport system permease protein n=1 Tax=Paeniglutamicibacter kerguelensis TaxID=254788 RepID=A0ABS4XIX4_9MICC|nr:ABC transporter permease [Paeniglutamicibacter kerguelensis]MBP2388390.1 simple sugar transport system permease protein [Paeniglutamicibacter kerguelensis]